MRIAFGLKNKESPSVKILRHRIESRRFWRRRSGKERRWLEVRRLVLISSLWNLSIESSVHVLVSEKERGTSGETAKKVFFSS